MDIEGREFRELLIRLSPTILGVKPAELLNVKLQNIDKYRRYFREEKEIKFIEIKSFKNIRRRQLFFYHLKSLKEILSQKANQNFLKSIGYPSNCEVDKYLEILITKLQSNIFPHEIGLFLGYPLKDVMGYMGLIQLKLVKTKGWKYYGNETLSEIQYKKFIKVRDVCRLFLDNFTTIKV